MDLQDYAEKFYQSKIAAQSAGGTIRTYRYHIGRALAWLTENSYTGADLVGVSGAESLEEYLLQLSLDHSAYTVQGAFRALRALYRWIERRYGIDGGSPFEHLQMPATPNLLPKAIPHNEFVLLLHSIPAATWIGQRDRLIIKLLFYTGMRLGEIAGLALGDVNTELRQIRVYRAKVREEGFIPISLSLQGELRAWLDEQRPACSHNGLWPTLIKGVLVHTPLTTNGLAQMTRRRCLAAGLKIYRPHSFRHACAVEIVRRGGDLSLVKDLLGHKDIATTTRYLRFDISRLTSQYDRIFE